MTQSARPILLVEDNAFDAELAIDALKHARLSNPIIHVDDGVEAMAYLTQLEHFNERAEEHPLFVLLDLNMTRMNGVETLAAIRADPRLRWMPVIMLTSSREEAECAQLWSLGVNGYVLKPLDAPQFFETVKTLGAFWALVNVPPPLPDDVR